jgi:hypothetical protein
LLTIAKKTARKDGVFSVTSPFAHGPVSKALIYLFLITLIQLKEITMRTKNIKEIQARPKNLIYTDH